MPFWYSGSAAPIMLFDHSNRLWRSSTGTPISSAMAISGSSAATSVTKSISSLARMVPIRSAATSR